MPGVLLSLLLLTLGALPASAQTPAVPTPAQPPPPPHTRQPSPAPRHSKPNHKHHPRHKTRIPRVDPDDLDPISRI